MQRDDEPIPEYVALVKAAKAAGIEGDPADFDVLMECMSMPDLCGLVVAFCKTDILAGPLTKLVRDAEKTKKTST